MKIADLYIKINHKIMEQRNHHNSTANEALTPAELIKKHNSDPQHKITEEELRNLKVGNDAEDEEQLKKDIERKQAEDNTHNHENNTYDIFDA